jgi:tripeptide aminopeptidase
MTIQDIVASLPGAREKLHSIREIVVANAVMISEVPASTGLEEERIEFICNRFQEFGLHNTSVDEAGNAQAVLPGKSSSHNILVAAHADTVNDESGFGSSVSVVENEISGWGIADNGLGLAALVSLPEIFRALEVELEGDVILLAQTRSLGRGDLGGIRFFLDHVKRPICAGVCVEGAQLGRLSYSCLGMNRSKIVCNVQADKTEWHQQGSQNALVTMSQILRRILAIPIPQSPRTTVIMGSMRAGTGYTSPPLRAALRFEVRSEQVGMAREIREQIEEIIDEVSAETGTVTSIEVLARRVPGGVAFSHPLVKATRDIMRGLNITPTFQPSVGDLAALIFKNIPSVTVGISRGHHIHEPTESVEIEPIFDGLAQLAGVLQFIDAHPGEMVSPADPQDPNKEEIDA